MARIVIVDDDEIIAELVSEILTGEGHMVSAVEDGDAALAAVLESEPDLVILDYALAGKTGMEILREIRSLPQERDMLIMMFTAREGRLHRLRAESDGADDYVTKPFEAKDLLARVEALLVGSQISRGAARGGTLDAASGSCLH